jgi:ABC-2 type transport system ATP-binding protein
VSRPAGNAAALRVQGLTQRYGRTPALQSLSFSLQPGSFTALLGPNGAGKSTLFQVLTGLFSADEGDVDVAGHSLRQAPAAALAQLGVVFQQGALDLDLSVRRNLLFHCQLHGLSRADSAQRIGEASAALGITAELDRPPRELSGGTRRKVELARALLHRPALLLMDEASAGLDVASRHALLAALHADVKARGTAVLWATHAVEEAEGAHRVLVLHRGRLLADGTPGAVTEQLGGGTLEAAFIRATTGPQPKETVS